MSDTSRTAEAADTHKEEFFRSKEAARFLKISERTLHDWMSGGLIPFAKVSHKVVLFKRSDLERAIAHLPTWPKAEGGAQ